MERAKLATSWRTYGTLAALLLATTALSGCLEGGALTGKPAPAFEFVTSEGVLVNNSTYLGRFVILDLMATWCGPCRLEVAHLREIQELHGEKVVIISVGTDPKETVADLEAFGARYGADWPYAIDRSGAVRETMQMRIIPKLVILDPEGVVVFERSGEVYPAAISRVIDPSTSAGLPWLAGLAAAGLGFLAAFNPYRRVHRDGPGGGPTLAALGILAALAFVAWPFAGLVSSRATYGSLFVGGITLLAAAWWFRARRKAAPTNEGTTYQRVSDRTYELAPHYAGALVLGLSGLGVSGFFSPLFLFLAAAVAGFFTRPRLAPRTADLIGLAGLVLAGAGLLYFGSRILVAYG